MNDPVTVFLAVIVTGLAALLTLLSVLSFRVTKDTKIGLVSLAFVVFLAKGAFLLLYSGEGIESAPLVPLLSMDCLVLVLMYVAVTKR